MYDAYNAYANDRHRRDEEPYRDRYAPPGSYLRNFIDRMKAGGNRRSCDCYDCCSYNNERMSGID